MANWQNLHNRFILRNKSSLLFNREIVYFRSQILERPSIGEYWNISGVPVLPENVIFTFFRTCWCYSEAYNTGTQKWSSIVQYSCTSIWDLKYTFSCTSTGNTQCMHHSGAPAVSPYFCCFYMEYPTQSYIDMFSLMSGIY